jgi:hypothetical protein
LSSSTYAADPGYAWFVAFGNGAVSYVSKAFADNYVRAVRGGL